MSGQHKIKHNRNREKRCNCENLYYINETNNHMFCCNEDNKYLCLEKIATTIITIASMTTYPRNTETTIIFSPPTTIIKITTETPSTKPLTTLFSIPEIYSTFPHSSEIQIITQNSQLLNTLPSNIELERLEPLNTELNNPSNKYEYEEKDSTTIYDERTCITQEDNLAQCIPIDDSFRVFNYICFPNFDDIINNLKNISEKTPIINTYPNVTIHIYTTQNAKDKSLFYTNLSFIFLNECEDLLRNHYNLSNDTTIYIIGIDSPNKNKSYVVNVYNYGVYLENGFQLDHIEICKDVKITISSPIVNTESIKLDKGNYFSNSGYDIYDKNNFFYNDYCSPASINGKDIILSDRKKDFYPENYTLCNNSCEYIYTNYNETRFYCYCNLTYNFSNNDIYIDNNEKIEAEDISYLDYSLSLINYKIFLCYKLLLS